MVTYTDDQVSNVCFLSVLNYWLGDSPNYELWFYGGEKLDPYIRETFSDTHRAVSKGELQAVTLFDKLAVVILLDQFSRHIYRGTPNSFASDKKALELSLEVLRHNLLEQLNPFEQLFFLLPLQHSEDAQHSQMLIVYLDQQLHTSEEPFTSAYKSLLLHTHAHQRVLNEFGRYPKRNAALGRKSTPEEITYLNKNPTGIY
jgi:uncharacterized protein (DUF924 family)